MESKWALGKDKRLKNEFVLNDFGTTIEEKNPRKKVLLERNKRTLRIDKQKNIIKWLKSGRSQLL